MTYQHVCNFLDFIKSKSLQMLEDNMPRYAGSTVFNVGEACQFPPFCLFRAEMYVYRLPGTTYHTPHRYVAIVRDRYERDIYCVAWFSFHNYTTYTMDLLAMRNGPGEILGCLRRHHSISTTMPPGFSIFKVERT